MNAKHYLIKLLTIICVATFSAMANSSPTTISSNNSNISDDLYQELMGVTNEEGSVWVVITLDLPEAQDKSNIEKQISTAQASFLNGMAEYIEIETAQKAPLSSSVLVRVSAKGLEKIKRMPKVRAISGNSSYSLQLDSSTTIMGKDSNGKYGGGYVLFHGWRKVWKSGYNGSGKTIAIIDTGVDNYSNLFLYNKVVNEACFDYMGGCDNGQTQQYGAGSGKPCVGSSNCSHGTFVAGIAAGINTDPLSLLFHPYAPSSGVAKSSDIISIRVGHLSYNQSNCDPHPVPCVLSSAWDFKLALEYVYSLRNSYDITSVNYSWGFSEHSSTCDAADSNVFNAINNLRNVGIATVVSTGNSGLNGKVSWPSCKSNVIRVGAARAAYGRYDTIEGYSNYWPGNTLFAIGCVDSSIPGGWSYGCGTSYAAPHVAGAFAVMKEKYPNDSVDSIYNRLWNTSKSLRNPLIIPPAERGVFLGDM